MTYADSMFTINMICDFGIFRQVFNGTEEWFKQNHFFPARICKTKAILLLQFLVTNRQVPSHVGIAPKILETVSYTHLRAHETDS